jgi:hypothetical protein
MSSTYHLLCLSHDPAIIIGHEFTFAEIKTVTREHEALEEHPGCDIAAGRFSYPLIEVGCFGLTMTGTTGCKSYHSRLDWTDSDWLRLLQEATATSVVSAKTLAPLQRCWPAKRLRLLRGELGVPDLPAATPAEQCCVCGSPDVTYHNYQDQPFCWPCADGQRLRCGRCRNCGLAIKQASDGVWRAANDVCQANAHDHKHEPLIAIEFTDGEWYEDHLGRVVRCKMTADGARFALQPWQDYSYLESFLELPVRDLHWNGLVENIATALAGSSCTIADASWTSPQKAAPNSPLITGNSTCAPS